MSVNNQKWSFDVVKAQVEQLQKEFNSKLVSVLNSCNGPVICPVITNSSYAGTLNNFPTVSKESPIHLNLINRLSIGMCAEYIYSEDSST